MSSTTDVLASSKGPLFVHQSVDIIIFPPAELACQGPGVKQESDPRVAPACGRGHAASGRDAAVSYTTPLCRRSGAKQPLVLQLPSALLACCSFFLDFQRCASGSMKRESEESR